MPKYPFEAPFDEILRDAEGYVDAVFSCLESEFLVMPKGVGFVEYPAFERGYEALKTATKGFSELESDKGAARSIGRAHFHRGSSHNARLYAAGMGLCDDPANRCERYARLRQDPRQKDQDVAGNAAQRKRSNRGKAESAGGNGLSDAR